MTVTSEESSVEYTGDGSQTEFAVPFYFIDSSHLVVTVTTGGNDVEQVEGVDYAVSGEGDEDGGTVTFTTAPANATSVLVERILPITQETDFSTQGVYSPRNHELALDRQTMVSQYLLGRIETLENSVEFLDLIEAIAAEGDLLSVINAVTEGPYTWSYVHTFSKGAIFTGAAGGVGTSGEEVGLRGYGRPGVDADGIEGFGSGAGAGVLGTGGPDDAPGVYGIGEATADGVGVEGVGTGAGRGVVGRGGITDAPGVYGEGHASANGNGVEGVASGDAVGVAGWGGTGPGAGVLGEGGDDEGDGGNFIGGGTAGNGVVGTAMGGGVGAAGYGGLTGKGMYGEGGSTSGNGGHFKAVAGASAGVLAEGGPAAGPGVDAQGGAGGYGVKAAGNSAPAVYLNNALAGAANLRFATQSPTGLTNGDVWFDGTDLKLRSGGVTYTLTKT